MTSKTLSTALLALSLTAATAAFAGTAPASGTTPAKPAVKTTASAKQTQHHRFLHRRSASTSSSKTDANKKKDGKGSN
jgi:hypothetical protein